MKKFMLAALLALGVVACAVPAIAQEKGGNKDDKPAEKKDEKKEEAKEEADEGMGAVFKGTKEITGKVTITEENVKRYLKLNDSWNEAMAGDEKWQEVQQESIKGAYEHASKSTAAQEWAKKNEVELDDWLRTSMRIMTSALLVLQMEDIKNQVKELEALVKEYEAMPEAERDEDYDFIVLFLTDALNSAKEFQTGLVKHVPEPTADEKKILEANKDALLAILNGGDEG